MSLRHATRTAQIRNPDRQLAKFRDLAVARLENFSYVLYVITTIGKTTESRSFR
jgi:hypothetical protein